MEVEHVTTLPASYDLNPLT